MNNYSNSPQVKSEKKDGIHFFLFSAFDWESRMKILSLIGIIFTSPFAIVKPHTYSCVFIWKRILRKSLSEKKNLKKTKRKTKEARNGAENWDSLNRFSAKPRAPSLFRDGESMTDNTLHNLGLFKWILLLRPLKLTVIRVSSCK